MVESVGASSAASTGESAAASAGGFDAGSASSFDSAISGSSDTIGSSDPLGSSLGGISLGSFDSVDSSLSSFGASPRTSPDIFGSDPLGLSTPAPSFGSTAFDATDPFGFSTAAPGAFTGLSSAFGPANLSPSQEFSPGDINPVTNNTITDVTPLGQITAEVDDQGQLLTGETLADATKTAAAAAVGYRGAMYGEVGVGPWTADIARPQQFGRFTPGSTLANPSFEGYGIDNFAQRAGWAAPQQTMISSQAAWEYARQEARTLGIPARDVTFEVRELESQPGVRRTYDLQLRPDLPLTEIKAGSSIKSQQLNVDIAAAMDGLRVDYEFAGNPITGNHGPSPATAARLNAATAATNNNFTFGVTDVAPSRAGIQAVETAAQISGAARAFGRVAAPIGVAADAYAIGSGIAADGGTFGRNATVATAGAAGGWAGAAGGAWGGVQAGTVVGTMIGGPVGAAVGAVAGGLIGAIGGGLLGAWGGESAARAATN